MFPIFRDANRFFSITTDLILCLKVPFSTFLRFRDAIDQENVGLIPCNNVTVTRKSSKLVSTLMPFDCPNSLCQQEQTGFFYLQGLRRKNFIKVWSLSKKRLTKINLENFLVIWSFYSSKMPKIAISVDNFFHSRIKIVGNYRHELLI